MEKRGKREKRRIESYAHTEEERANNPPVGLVTPDPRADAWAKNDHPWRTESGLTGSMRRTT